MIFSSRKLALTLSTLSLLGSAALFSACDTGGSSPTATAVVAAPTTVAPSGSAAVPSPVGSKVSVPSGITTRAATVPAGSPTVGK